MVDDTNAVELRSWVESANDPSCDFPIQNLPFGVFENADDASSSPGERVGVAIGDQIVDVVACAAAGLFTGDAADAASRCRGRLDALMAMGRDGATALRRTLSVALRADAPRRDLRPDTTSAGQVDLRRGPHQRQVARRGDPQLSRGRLGREEVAGQKKRARPTFVIRARWTRAVGEGLAQALKARPLGSPLGGGRLQRPHTS